MYGVGNRGFGVRNGSCAAPEKAEEVNTLTRAIVLASGKGGTGKTSVTAGIGCALAKLGYRCLMIDADAGMQSLDMALNQRAMCATEIKQLDTMEIQLESEDLNLNDEQTYEAIRQGMEKKWDSLRKYENDVKHFLEQMAQSANMVSEAEKVLEEMRIKMEAAKNVAEQQQKQMDQAKHEEWMERRMRTEKKEETL